MTEVVGYRVPGGTFRVEDYERVISHDAVGAPAIEPPLLHPLWIILGALRGMGVRLGHVLELAGTSEDAVLFGEVELEQEAPLRSGVAYQVEGGVTELVRRHGRRAGAFDLMKLRLEILDERGVRAAAATQSFIIPRPGDDAA